MKKFILVVACFSLCAISTFTQTQNLQWVNQVGSGGSDYVYGLSTDASGNIYATGGFSGTVDFDPGPGTSNLTSSGSNDIFVAKYNSTGNLIWAKKFGGTSVDYGSSLGVDASGNIYVTGYFQGTADFDPDAGTFNLTSLGQYDIFNFKLTNIGNLVWAVSYGGTGFDFGRRITVDAAGNSYTTGTFRSIVDFDPGAGTNNVTSLGLEDVYIEKLDPNGNLLWNRRVGGTGSDAANGITLDGVGSVYITGGFSGTADMDPGGATNNLISNGGIDCFILRLDIASNFIWVRGFGGTGTDISNSVAIDPSGNILSGGIYVNTVDFDPGAGISNLTASNSSSEGYILQLSSAGNYNWVKNISCDNNSQVKDISIGTGSNVYITGRYIGNADLDPGSSNINVTATPGGNVFNLILDQSGNHVSSNGFGDVSNPDEGYCVQALPHNNFVSGGFFNGTPDFDPQAGIANLTSLGGDDGFIQKICLNTTGIVNTNACSSYLSPSGNYQWNASGTYTDTLANIGGCDSIITVNLTILSSNSTIDQNTCDSVISPSGNYVWNITGTYNDTIPNHVGCDSIITVNVTLLPTTSTVNINACRYYISPSTIYTWTSSGIYTDTLLNVIGCDSIVTINLSLTNIDTTITINNGIFTVAQPGALYQWYDCIAQSNISGAINQTYTPLVNGDYGIIVSLNGCTDTTACYTINNVGTEDISSASLNIYPNPAKEYVQVASDEIITQWKLVDITGKTVIARNENKTTFNISLEELTPGIYFIQLNIGASIIVKQLIIVE